MSVEKQLELLRARGLAVTDEAEARHYLRYIGYYRLSGYALPFQRGGSDALRHQFSAGVTFCDLLDRYVFDRKLRLLVMDAIERIEVAMRASLTSAVALRHGAHWYRNASLFDREFDHAAYVDEIRREIGHAPGNARRRDVHVEHYYKTYSTPDMPPCWMVFESVPFGIVSRSFKNLLPANVKSICDSFGLAHPVLASWLHGVNYIRNLCAHHARLWNRECRIKPMIPRSTCYVVDLTPNSRLYAQLVVMQILLSRIAPGTHWAERLRDLLAEHSAVPIADVGFPANWMHRPVWGLGP